MVVGNEWHRTDSGVLLGRCLKPRQVKCEWGEVEKSFFPPAPVCRAQPCEGGGGKVSKHWGCSARRPLLCGMVAR